MIDFGLTTNEVILFEKEAVNFIDKSKLRDSIIINQSINAGRPDFGPFVEGKETFGNSLRAKIALRLGLKCPNTTNLQSPSNKSSRYGGE